MSPQSFEVPPECESFTVPAETSPTALTWVRSLIMFVAGGLAVAACTLSLTSQEPGTPAKPGTPASAPAVASLEASLHTLKVASWNLGCMDFASTSELAEEMEGMDADVILTQEDIEFLTKNSSKPLAISGYTLASTCRAEALWDSMKAYKEGGRFLQNAIYVRDSTLVAVRSFARNLSDTAPNPRCAAFADVLPVGIPLEGLHVPLRVASVHLTGGRFVAGHWRNFSDEKPKQVRAILAELPDIVGGDLNSFPDAAQAAASQKQYSPYIDAVEAGEERGYLSFATGGVEELFRGGMSRAPADGKTSRYGGTIDHVFFKAPRLAYAKVAETRGDMSMSDHNAVLVTLHLSSDSVASSDERHSLGELKPLP